MTTPKKLQLLTDSTTPIEKDAFNHEVYADLLREIFTPSPDNCGISVGLFGKWGQGKSSIVDMLGEQPPEKTKIIVFNAWQARGDCVRRQLFIEVLQAINPAEAEKMKQFAGLEVARELIQTEDDKQISKNRAKQKLWKSLMEDKALGFSAVGTLLLLTIPTYQISSSFFLGTQINWANTLTQTAILPALFFLLKYVRETVVSKYTGLLGISEPISESQRLKYPEQFKELFVKHSALFCHEQGQEILVVVDDLDRCEPETVVEALAAIRQFKGTQAYVPNDGEKHHGKKLPMFCRFLVPCDEKQVVLALEADGHDAGDEGGRYHDYQSEELLRKFFDVIVRMDQLLPQDLTQYAETLATEIGIDDLRSIRHLIYAVSPKDPRQVKKLINAFKTTMRRIELSIERGLLEDLTDLTNTLLSIVALRETYPCIYNDIIAPAPERLALLCDQKYDELCNLEEIKAKNRLERMRFKNTLRKAGEMLLRLPSLHMSTAELLIHGQADPELRGVPRQGELHRSVLANNSEQFLKAIPESEEHRNQVFKWFNGKIESGETPQKVQAHLAFILDYAKENPDGLGYVTNSLHHLLENTQYQNEVLESFKRIDELAEAVVKLSPKEQKIFWKNIELDALNEKAKLFFNVGNRLPDSEIEYLGHALHGMLHPGSNEAEEETKTEEIIAQINDCLPDDRDTSVGLLPSIGEEILVGGWNPADEEDTEYTIQTKVGLHLIGNNTNAGYETLLQIMEKDLWSEAFAKPNDEPDFNAAWQAATELLQRMDKDMVDDFFDWLHDQILAPQSGDLVEYFYERLKPVLYSFTEEQLTSMGTSLGTRLTQGNNDWIFDFIGTPQDAAKWDTLTKSCAEQYISSLSGRIQHTEKIALTMSLIEENKWNVVEQMDSFLVEKFDSATEGADLKKWADCCLNFLAGKRAPLTKEKVLSCVESQNWLNTAIYVGIKTCWRASISRADAELIATGLLKADSSRRLFTWLSYARLPKKKGAEHVFNVLISKVNAHDVAWQAANQNLLEYIARYSSKLSSEKHAVFISILDSMLTSEKDPIILSALKIVESFSTLNNPLKKVIRNLTQSENVSDAVKPACSELLKK